MYYNPDTQEKLSRTELKSLLNASFPQDAEEVGGWHLLHNGSAPEVQEGQSIAASAIELVDGKYVQTWEVSGTAVEESAEDVTGTETRIAALEDAIAELAEILSEVV